MTDPLNEIRTALQQENLLDTSYAARKLLSENPVLGSAWGEVAEAAMTAGDEVSALKAAEKLVEAAPQHDQSWLWLASMHSALGDHANALRVLEQQTARFAQSGAMQRRAGRALLELNQPATAELCFRRALELDGTDVLAWEGLAQTKTFGEEDPDLVLMEQLRIGWPSDTPPETRGILSYALAKAYDDVGELDVAARRVAEGAAFVRERQPFDIERHEAGVQHILSIYDLRFAEANEEAGALDARPVFVLAPPKAGASWLSSVLASGEDVGRLPRSNSLFWMAAAPLGDHRPQDLLNAFIEGGANVLADVGKTYLHRLSERFNARTTRIIDPTGLGEMAGGTMGLCLPAARFVQITRDPRDAAWSIYKHRFLRARHWSYHPDDIARVLAAHNRMCERWQSLYSERFLTVSYEDLARDPQDTLGKICAFTGIDGEAVKAEAWLRSDMFKSDPVGVHSRAGARFEVVEAALQRAGLV